MRQEPVVPEAVRRRFRRGAWAGAIVAVLVALFGLIFPQVALTFVALLIGIYLVVSGVLRLITAFGAGAIGTGLRWALGLIGALLVVGGILALNNPFGTLVALVVVLGISWILDGAGYVLAAVTVRRVPGWWAMALAGVLLALAGIAVLVSSLSALAAFLFFFSLLLLIVGAVTIVVLGATARRSAR
ncbi:MAG TPA: DUF308 domain-containing protein [Pseudolysinimonas sp.]|nr:DUF308 domain-containing protein [Pseudolysinimonas sp.]